jgi:hypothetical protein
VDSTSWCSYKKANKFRKGGQFVNSLTNARSSRDSRVIYGQKREILKIEVGKCYSSTHKVASEW